ncbi:MAG: 4Fe-4S dicluster domain-containing protein [Acidobacteria bacterium]|nr:4Fe-4S dicluster domain-containing protein [Acidobacteriota bacterium]
MLSQTTTETSGMGSNTTGVDKPRWEDYSRCIRCGLCLNQCPTYRELGVEMDSPRGRIYQMVLVEEGRLALSDSYVLHIDRCLDCRACETACPSGVEYGKLVEAARAQIAQHYRRPWLERLLRYAFFQFLIAQPAGLKAAARLLGWYQSWGLQQMVRQSGLLKAFPRLAALEPLTPTVETPSFFSQIGKVFQACGPRRFRVALHSGCIANIAFARLQEATVRVLQANGCEVIVPAGQVCCGALHVHAGWREEARKLARRNIEFFAKQDVDAIVTNAAGCGSSLKEYGYLFKDEPSWAAKASEFSNKVKDVLEFLGEAGLVQPMRPVSATVTYQDSCHLLHGQKIRRQPRLLLKSMPGLRVIEIASPEICCGSAGIYNVTQTELSLQLLRSKMVAANRTGAEIIATANPGCILQLRAGVQLYGSGQKVLHVVELLDQARGEE